MARVILTQRHAGYFCRKRGVPTATFRRLEAGRPENRVPPISECTCGIRVGRILAYPCYAWTFMITDPSARSRFALTTSGTGYCYSQLSILSFTEHSGSIFVPVGDAGSQVRLTTVRCCRLLFRRISRQVNYRRNCHNGKSQTYSVEARSYIVLYRSLTRGFTRSASIRHVVAMQWGCQW
jgi:hypothetical protein